MTKPFFLLPAFLLLWVIPQQVSHAVSNTSQIRETIRKLQSVPLKADDDPDIPEQARPLLTVLKHQLLDCITEILNQDSAITSRRLADALKREGIPVSDDWDQTPYGTIYAPDVERPKANPDFLIVTTTLPVICGVDTSVYLFQRSGSGWQRIQDVESNNYKDISGALTDVGYSLSPRDKNGDSFLVVVDINPWCTSNWQRIRYRIFRIPVAPHSPKMILSREEGIYLRLDPYELSTTAGGFDLRFRIGSRDPGIHNYTHVVHYKLEKDSAIRVAPFAEGPNDFLEEWTSLPWTEASKWSISDQNLKYWHDTLASINYWEFTLPLFQISANEWRLQFELNPGDENSASLEADIVKKGQLYYVRDIHPAKTF